MATGDAALAAGMVLVPGAGMARDLDLYDNQTRDYVAQYATRQGPLLDIWVQAAAPAHKAGRIWIKTT
jgi:hypothetical protein